MFLYLLFTSLISPSHALMPVSCFMVIKDSLKVEWTAYKFTEKTGVKGTFKTITPKVKGAPQTVDEMVLQTSFEIDSLSVDTGNQARDTTLSEHFFKLMKNPKITGNITGIKDGKAMVSLTMNDVTRLVPFTYVNKNGTLTATGSIDVMDFAMSTSMKKINESCRELHKGADGVSKTWSTVDLVITATPVNTCKKKG